MKKGDVQGNILTVEIANSQDHTIFPQGKDVSITLKKKSLHVLPHEDAVAE